MVRYLRSCSLSNFLAFMLIFSWSFSTFNDITLEAAIIVVIAVIVIVVTAIIIIVTTTNDVGIVVADGVTATVIIALILTTFLLFIFIIRDDFPSILKKFKRKIAQIAKSLVTEFAWTSMFWMWKNLIAKKNKNHCVIKFKNIKKCKKNILLKLCRKVFCTTNVLEVQVLNIFQSCFFKMLIRQRNCLKKKNLK